MIFFITLNKAVWFGRIFNARFSDPQANCRKDINTNITTLYS